ncbi:SapC family protein [Burkholderiaceae bacterium DAT-1]|nr:SapC family protein [Burkholderiaceae bacterium DAT-1]
MFHKQENIKPVNSESHSKLKLGPVTDFRFAAEVHAIPVIGSEFNDLAREFPIVFAQAGDNSYVPTVMVGLRPNQNLFIKADGSWDARYVPHFVRRYPFVTVEVENNDALICIDEAAADKLSAEDGFALYEAAEDGKFKPTEAMQQWASVLFRMRDEGKQVAEWTKLLADANLFKQVSASADLPDGEKVSMDGMFVIDEEKLRQLPADKAHAWLSNGLLALVYAHLVSLANLQNLATRLVEAETAK